jgi:translocation and assembly module TamA
LTVPIGGNGLAETSLEVRYQITSNIELAVFFDTGFVSSDDLLHGFRNSSDSFFGSMQYAVGIGARYLTVVGPIRVDLAWRLPIGPPLTVINPQGVDYNQDTACFGMGFIGGHRSGSPEGVCAFHLSIGEAF